MKILPLSVAVLMCLSLSSSCWAQSGWNWKRLNWFAKEKQEEVAPIELTDEPAKPRWQNPLAEMNLRPRPIEWHTPAFVRRMNENSARMWRTTRRSVGHWASSTGAAIRNSTYDTWDAMTRSTTPKSQADPESSVQPAPNFGGVNEFLSKPKLKF